MGPPRSRLRTGCAGLLLVLVVTARPASARPDARFAFDNADIPVVVAEVARLTGTTFLFDPARVQGRITILPPGDVSPAQALVLLRSALALHGYAVIARPEGAWIVPAGDVPDAGVVMRVIRLTYADAGHVAFTLGWAAPPGVRVVPFHPTNSVVISGPAADVEQLLGILHGPRAPGATVPP